MTLPSDESGDEDDVNDVDLGRLEKTEPWKLESRYFPCKVGQKPAWLAFSEDIPSQDDLLCTSCNKTRMFLLQLYAPITESDACFHRMLYVFVCNTSECLKTSDKCFKILRCQLPRVNDYYPYDPPEPAESWGKDICAASFGLDLCNVCGIRCSGRCASCKNVSYCRKEHQVYDWKNGHKKVCKVNEKANVQSGVSFLFPEYEVIIEPERSMKPEGIKDEDQSAALEAIGEGSLAGIPCEEELSKMALADDDKLFTAFRERVDALPDQVIRYDRNGAPLWVSDKNMPLDGDAARCPYCGSGRVFEFQIMPQLLNFLNLESVGCESLDWGTVAVFTCEGNCAPGPAYKEEFAVKQDFSS